MDIVIADGVLILVAWLMLGVSSVVIFPHPVVNPIHPHIHEHKKVPGLLLYQIAHDFELLLAHGVNLLEQEILVLGSELTYVNVILVAAQHSVNLVAQLIGVSVLLLHRGGEKAGDEVAVDRPDGIGLRHADDDDLLSSLAQIIPNELFLHRRAGSDGHLVIGIVGPVAETIEPEHAGVFSAEHGTPGWHGNGGYTRHQLAIDAILHQSPQIGQLVPPHIKDQLRRAAVQANDQDLLFFLLAQEFEHNLLRCNYSRRRL